MDNRQYKIRKLEEPLIEAFVSRKVEDIVSNKFTRGIKFLNDSIDYGISRGFLKIKENISDNREDEVYSLELTQKGREYFGLK